MAVFVYEAKNINGNILKGKMEAADVNAVSVTLREKNYFPIVVKPFKKSFNVDFSEMQKVTLKDIAIFCRQFSVIISSGIAIVKAVEIVRDQTENQKFKNILGTVSEEIQKGKTFSVALKEHNDIPKMLINMIEVGEASGTLDSMLDTVAKYYEKEYKQRQKVKSATTYPKLIAGFATVVVIGLVTFIVPTMASTIMDAGVELPLPTRIILGLSKFFQQYGIIALLVTISIITALKIKAASKKNELKDDKFKIKLPVFGKIYMKIVTSRFARTFGILMTSGVPMLQSLDICVNIIDSKVIGDCLTDVKESIKRGGSLGESLIKKNIFPPMLTQMIKIGEESGNLDGVLEKTSDFYDEEVEAATAQLTSMIEPMIIIILAVIVGFIVMAIALPMFALNDTIK